jgi:hypothetical protein
MKLHTWGFFSKSFHALKNQTLMRRAITPHERLSITYWFLATGRNYEDLNVSAAISPHALGVIIPETCRATYEELNKEYCMVWKIILTMNYHT